MKRTLYVVDFISNEKPTISSKKITCELAGEMASGEKVWYEVDTQEQYFMGRAKGKNGMKGICYFYQQ